MILDARNLFHPRRNVYHIGLHQAHSIGDGLRRQSAREPHAMSGQALAGPPREVDGQRNTGSAELAGHTRLDEKRGAQRLEFIQPMEILVTGQMDDHHNLKPIREQSGNELGRSALMQLRAGKSGLIPDA